MDVNTLFILTMHVEAMLGILLLLVWLQNKNTHGVAWWGSAHLMRSVSVVLYGTYGWVPNLVSIDLASALLFTSFGVTWTGARVFDGRKPLPGSLCAGAILWLIVCQVPGFTDALYLRGLMGVSIIAAFSWATAYEFWRGRGESLVSRWPAIVLLFSNGVLFLVRTPLVTAISRPINSHGILSSAWLTVMSAEALLFTIAIAFVLLAMAKERAELRQRTAAMVDPLTGLANRRAFLQLGEETIRMQVKRGRPVAVFLLDFDHFKAVNDQYGHLVGDIALRTFAEIAGRSLRPSDIVGRIGGEEFAVLLTDADRDNAYLVAERLRTNFESAAVALGAHNKVHATLSIGVSIIQEPTDDLALLLERADQALYRAKAKGRNRVELSDPPSDPSLPETPDMPERLSTAA
ncbi:MAG: GGDEF domain-containing protein [Variibacter sp.]